MNKRHLCFRIAICRDAARLLALNGALWVLTLPQRLLAEPSPPGQIEFVGDVRLTSGVSTVLTCIEGVFGAVVMVGSGLMALVCAALSLRNKNRRLRFAALFLFLIAIAAFVVRFLVGFFFNDDYMMSP